ncbi:MAG: FCD domain-containing protein [Thermovirgaceae bacterium]
MNPEAAEQELFVLRLLEETEGPVGAGTVREFLASEGFSASEATVGRLLRDLDRRGLTSRVGFQGRVLTDLGSRRLTELSEARQQEASAGTLLERIHASSDDAALDLLIARETVEGRIARLAAERCENTSREEVISALEGWKNPRGNDSGAMEAYRAFFETLAKLAGNGILAAMDGILLAKDGGSALSSGASEAVTEDLEALAHAVCGKDPDAAENAVQTHIQRLLKGRKKQKV